MKRILIISDNGIIRDKITNKDPFLKDIKHYIKVVASNGHGSMNLSDLNVVNEIIDFYDLVISFHCTQIFPKDLYEKVSCINIHPGLNPYNRGYFPHVHSIINGLPAGITIHEINGIIDGGNVIYQEEISINEYDTSKDVYDRLIEREYEIFKEKINIIIDGNYEAIPIESGNYNSMDDYIKMCQIDLGENNTFEHHINVLRALSHDPYDNAYFIDSDGNKVYVKITLEKS